MTRKNPYENQDDTLDIPDFVEDRSTYDTSTSPDMSIFKMSDDELYDDIDDEKEEPEQEEEPLRRKKPVDASLILSIITICVLLAACAGAAVYALRQHKAYVEVNTEYQKLAAKQSNFDKQLAEKDAQIAELNKQIEALKQNGGGSSSSGTQGGTVYVVTDGPISFRSSPNKTDNFIEYQGKDKLENGEKFTALEVVKGQDDPEYSYAKIAEGVYLNLGTGTADDTYAKKAD